MTSGKRAEVTISIGNPDFTPFHADAYCAIRPQSLIGEEYVDCQPGTSSAPALPLIKKGPGTGSHYLPVTRTSSPIDTDIVQNISQEPVRQSLAVIIDEFGTGLAARGSDLNAVIHRANPALGDTDKVIRILARQNRQLAQLATDSDTVLAPLARERHQISTFVTQANATSVASAQRAADISKTFHLFPSYLRQLKPLLADLGVLADQGTPLMTTLGKSASALGQQFANLTPFAGAARKALIELGNASPTVTARAARVDAARAAAEQARHRRQADRQVTRSADREPREHGRDPAADGSAVQRRGGRQRLRQPRTLRARRTAGLELHELRGPARYWAARRTSLKRARQPPRGPPARRPRARRG